MAQLVLSLTMDNDLPFVAAACFCDQALVGNDGAVTLVRMIDTLTIQPLPTDLRARGMAKLTMFVSVKSGAVSGTHEMRIDMRTPDGKVQQGPNQKLEMKGNEVGVNLKIDTELRSPMEGLYWFDVMWEGRERLTSIPLRIKLAEAPQPIPETQP